MTKRKTILAVLLGVIMTLCLAFAVACGGEEAEMGTLKWTINDPYNSVTVTVDGSTERPEQYAVGETLTFKVETKSGYTVTVQNGRATLNGNSNNEYSFAVKKGNNEIVITVKRQITGVAVETPPTKLTYYAGEKVDETGMVVIVSYATGESEAVESGYIINYPTDAGYFVLGDTSFTVSYGTMTTAAVELAAPVEVKVTINPVGGVINEGYLTVLSARTDLKNYATEEGGTISFTYSKLDSAIVLPTNEEILLDGGKESSLAGWLDADNNSYKQISVENKLSLDLHANWNLVLVDMQEMELVLENGTPYLALTMSINTNFSAYAYFYEGNKKIEVKGETIEGKAGETVTAKIDLTQLEDVKSVETGSPVDARGAWMDIRVNTTINGVDLTQDFIYNPLEPIAEVGQMIHDDKYCYRIRISHDGDVDYYKVYFNDYLTTYEMDVKEVDGKATLVMNGQVNTNLEAATDFPFENAEIAITFGSAVVKGKVKADGFWEASLDLTTVESGLNAMATTAVLTAAEGGKTLSVDLNGKLDLIGCGTIFDYHLEGGNPRYFQTTKTINGWKCTIGGDWNEPFLIVVDTTHEVIATGADLETGTDGKIYLVLNGTCGSAITSADELKNYLYLDIQSNSDAKSVDGWNVYWRSTDENNGMQLSVENGTWTLKVAIPEAALKAGAIMFAHFGNGSSNLVLSDLAFKSTVIGELRYTLGTWTGWNSQLVSIWVTEKDTVIVTATAADLVAENGKVYLSISGSAYSTEKEAIEATVSGIWVDLQKRGDDWYRNQLKEPVITVNEDGTWTAKYDLTNVEAHGNPYTGHFGGTEEGNTGDLKLPTSAAEDGKSVTLNGRKYTLVNKNGATDEANNWGCVSVKIEEVAAE